jgi:hypothetical protein
MVPASAVQASTGLRWGVLSNMSTATACDEVAGDYVCRLTGFSFPAPLVRDNMYLSQHLETELFGT